LSKKKPTKKDIEIVISNLINHIKAIEERIVALDNVFGLYIKYKKEGYDNPHIQKKALQNRKLEIYRALVADEKTYIDLITESTIDEKIVKALKNKIDIGAKVLGEEARQWLKIDPKQKTML